jgi:hypothetical protein
MQRAASGTNLAPFRALISINTMEEARKNQWDQANEYIHSIIMIYKPDDDD